MATGLSGFREADRLRTIWHNERVVFVKWLVEIGASEGIRTLDTHVGNVMLYQAELRSLPLRRQQAKRMRQNCKRCFPAILMPIAADPNVPVSMVNPVRSNPHSMWIRTHSPNTTDPDPSSVPGPVTGNPVIAGARGGHDYLGPRDGRRLSHDDLLRRCRWRGLHYGRLRRGWRRRRFDTASEHGES